MPPINIGVYIYDNAEILDFSGPYEVISTASRVCPEGDPLNVFLISESSSPVIARAGFRVLADYSIEDHPPLDVLIVAGGVHCGELDKAAVMAWLRSVSEQAQIVSSVCTGAFLLAKAQVLTHQNVTTHWEDIEDLRNEYPSLTVHENLRWVSEGKYLTSGGISAGIDMSLHLVERLHSLSLAEQTARQMEFDWTRTALEVDLGNF